MCLPKFFFILIISFFLILASVLVWGSPLKPQKSASNHYQAGYEFLRMGQPTKAAEEFESAFKIRPDNEKLHHSLGLTLLRRSSPPKSQRLIELLYDPEKENNQHRGTAFFWLGEAYKMEEDFDNALKYFKKAADKKSKFISQKRIKNTLESVQKLMPQIVPVQRQTPSDEADWWKGLAVLAGILFVAFCFVLGLNKWVLAPKDTPPGNHKPSHINSILIFLLVIVIIVFSALEMELISGDQFTDLIKIIVDFFRPYFSSKSFN